MGIGVARRCFSRNSLVSGWVFRWLLPLGPPAIVDSCYVTWGRSTKRGQVVSYYIEGEVPPFFYLFRVLLTQGVRRHRAVKKIANLNLVGVGARVAKRRWRGCIVIIASENRRLNYIAREPREGVCCRAAKRGEENAPRGPVSHWGANNKKQRHQGLIGKPRLLFICHFGARCTTRLHPWEFRG